MAYAEHMYDQLLLEHTDTDVTVKRLVVLCRIATCVHPTHAMRQAMKAAFEYLEVQGFKRPLLCSARGTGLVYWILSTETIL